MVCGNNNNFNIATSKRSSKCDKCQDPDDTTVSSNKNQLNIMHPLPNVSYGQVREVAVSSMESEYTTYESIDESYCHYEN